jgi:hypothetical protein
MKQFFAVLFLVFSFLAIQAQDTLRCYSVEYNNTLRDQYPELGTDEQFEQWLQFHADAFRESKGGRAVVTLPVVFHIIHANQAVGTGDNVAATFINAQLQQINHDFRRLQGTSGFNSNPVGADTEIQFCMATVNPQGQPMAEPGINRVNTVALGLQSPQFSTSYMDNTVKPATQWNPNQYINIWVARVGSFFGTILGYAQFPSQSGLPGLNANEGPANSDGVVVRPTTIGSTTVPNPASGPFRFGRTLTHELGHFFGLRHIWGDGGCNVDDFCADTPQQGNSTSGCPTGKVTCNTSDMIENYMDYTNDVCMNIFTLCQKNRIQIVMNNSPRRGSLINSPVCGGSPEPTCTGPNPTPTGLQNSLGPNGPVLSWQPVPGTTFCNIQAGIAPSGPTTTFTVSGTNPSTYTVNPSLLIPGTIYRWRVRCGCSQDPLVVSEYSPYRTQLFPASAGFTSGDSPVEDVVSVAEIFPNPTNGHLQIAYTNGDVPLNYTVYNGIGAIATQGQLPAMRGFGVHEVDLAGLPVGVYILRIGNTTHKVLKQ